MTSQQPKPEPKPIAPGSLENKFLLSRDAPLDKRMKRRHLAVYNFILDWYHSKYGDALASVRHIVATLKERDRTGEGFSPRMVQVALADLVTWGYLEQEKGAGRRASRYVPVWEFRSVYPGVNTTTEIGSVYPGVNECVYPAVNATDHSVYPAVHEDPLTPTRAQDPGTDKRESDCPAPTAPVTAPLGAGRDADAGQEEKQTTSVSTDTKVDNFEELWRAYDHKQRRVDARGAYDKIAPDAELHEAMIAAATKWRQHWARQNDPEAPRKTLGSWLRSEGFLEDPPTAYKPKERKAKPAPVASNDNVAPDAEEELPSFMRGAAKLWPKGRHVLQVIDSSVETCGGDQAAFFRFRILDGKHKGTEIEHRIYTECCVQSYQEAGRQILSQLITACDQSSIEDTVELHGFICAGQVIDGEVDYERLTEEEYEEHAA